MNTSHWYDGWFYDRLIAPNQDALFSRIRSLVRRGATVIDVGCGTGRLAFAISDIAERVVGIDLSLRNIKRARQTLTQRPRRGVSFEHASVQQILAGRQSPFDCAVLTYVLHEVDPSERIQLLNDVSLLAERVIIGDYAVPVPSGIWSALDEAVEFVAGRDHYRNFKSYVSEGGLRGLIGQTALTVLEDVKDTPRTSELLVLGSSSRTSRQ